MIKHLLVPVNRNKEILKLFQQGYQKNFSSISTQDLAVQQKTADTCVTCRKAEITEELIEATNEKLHFASEILCKTTWPNGLSKETLEENVGGTFMDLYSKHVPKIEDASHLSAKSLEEACTFVDPNISTKACTTFHKLKEITEYFQRCIQLGELKKSGDPVQPYASVIEDNIVSKVLVDSEVFGSPLFGSDIVSNFSSWFSIDSSLLKKEYAQVIFFAGFSVFLAVLIIFASYFLVTQTPESEKLSTYECGFEPYEDAKNKFDVQFYIVAILFVLFDIEIIIVLPWCLSLSSLSLLGYWSVIEFLLELGLGLVYVFCVGGLDWQKQLSM